MNILILIKLLAAHIIGDFFLQTDTICKGKSSKDGKRIIYLAIHSGINAALAYILVGMWECYQIPVIVFFTHYIIDIIKSSVNSNSTRTFIIDQLAHVTVVCMLWAWITEPKSCIIESWLSDHRTWVIIICYLLALKPASILLGTFIAKWTPSNNEKNSLPNAGSWIGYLERILILTFILVGCMEGIGFLLAAKSIFRFGELTKAREVKITEYVMIGTLSSFTIAILLGAVALKVLAD
ncbi:DUF3307 domain-containing protein [Prevotella koreensis]|uniref:DUF3307 domain-containing protein n=1 Tax=Prevotella koreensis TaxID=2490854 RepID=UPI003FA168F3